MPYTVGHPVISIISPNWNNKLDILECLDSLAAQDYPKNCMEIIVCDNGSTDGSQGAIHDWFAKAAGDGWHRLELIELPENQGIAAAYNAAVERVSDAAGGILRIESDIVIEPSTVRLLVETMTTDSTVGVVGAKVVLYDEPDCVQIGAMVMNWWTGSLKREYPGEVMDCDVVTGGAMLIKKSCLGRLDFFYNPARFLASEAEFCLRVQRLGYRIIYNPFAVVRHKTARSSARLGEMRTYYSAHDHFIMLVEFGSFPRNLVSCIYRIVWAGKKALTGNSVPLRAIYGAVRGELAKRTISPSQHSRESSM